MMRDSRFVRAKHRNEATRIIITVLGEHLLERALKEMPSALNYSRTIFPGRKRQDELEMCFQRIV